MRQDMISTICQEAALFHRQGAGNQDLPDEFSDCRYCSRFYEFRDRYFSSGQLSEKYRKKGQYIDVAMMDGCVPFNSLDGAGFLVSGKEPKREGERLNGGCIYDFYETKDGEYLSVGSLESQFWSRFCTAIGREDLIEGTVYPPNIDEVKAEIRGILKTKTRDEWVEVFSHYDARTAGFEFKRSTFRG